MFFICNAGRIILSIFWFESLQRWIGDRGVRAYCVKIGLRSKCCCFLGHGIMYFRIETFLDEMGHKDKKKRKHEHKYDSEKRKKKRQKHHKRGSSYSSTDEVLLLL